MSEFDSGPWQGTTTTEVSALAVTHVPAAPLAVPLLDVGRRPGGIVELGLMGPLPVDWALRMALGCAARRISWLRGHVAQEPSGLCRARLELDASLCDGELPDFLELALFEASRTPVFEPPLLEVVVSPPERGRGDLGDLEVEVHAWDAVGLLSGVLGRIDRAGFAVREIVLETEEDLAFHRLTLASRRSSPVSWRQRRELVRSLSSLLSAG